MEWLAGGATGESLKPMPHQAFTPLSLWPCKT